MRRVLLVFMVFACALLLCACGTPAGGPDDTTPISETEQADGVAENDDAVAVDAEDPVTGTQLNITRGDEVLNVGGVRIVYTGIDEGGPMGPWLMFDIENGGTDAITVQTSDILVNGSIETFPISKNVAPGSTEDAAQTIPYSALEELGINTAGIENVALAFTIFQSDTWDIIHKSGVVVVRP